MPRQSDTKAESGGQLPDSLYDFGRSVAAKVIIKSLLRLILFAVNDKCGKWAGEVHDFPKVLWRINRLECGTVGEPRQNLVLDGIEECGSEPLGIGGRG